MVQAVGLLFFGSTAGISFLGVGLTTAAGGLTLAGTLVNSLALAAVSSALAPDPPTPPRPDNIKANSKVSTGDRFLHFGNAYVGGNLAFHRSKDGTSYLLFVHGHGEITDFVQPYLNAIPVTLDGEGNVTDSQYVVSDISRVQLLTRRGLVPSAYYPEIEAVWPEWTPDHRLDGLSTTLMITKAVSAEADRTVYPSGDPQLRWEIQGSKFFDPRVDAESFTDNAAVVMAGLISHPDVFNRPDAVDYDDVHREALLCDTDTPLAQGGSEPLYRLSGSASLMEEPQNTLAAMMHATGSKAVLKPDGRVAIRVGVWREPVLTLTTDDLLEIQEIPGQPGVGEGYNVASARYVDPLLNYTEVDMEPYSDADRIAESGGELEIGLSPMLYSPSQPQSRLAAKIRMERDNPRTKLRAMWRPHVIAAISEPFVTLDLPELGLQGTYEVASSGESYEAGGLVGVSLELNEFRQEAMILDIDDQGEVQELPTPNLDDGLPTPQNVVAAGAGVQISQNSFAAGISVVWDLPFSDAIATRVETRAPSIITPVDQDDDIVTPSPWVPVTVPAGEQRALIGGLADGDSYSVRVTFVAPSGQESDPVTLSGVIARASSLPPSEPTSFTATVQGPGQVLLTATTSSSADLWKTQLLRDGVLIHEEVTPPNAQLSHTDEPGMGTYDYTARSINISGVASASDAGPETITSV